MPRGDLAGMMPRVPWPLSLRSEVPSWLLRRPIAHRGLHDERCPENSLAAFEAAAAAGRPFELDVHLSADGQAVVFHDETLERMTGCSGWVAERTRDELSALRLVDTDESIPSLDQTLGQVAGRVPVLVELKNCAPVGRLERAVCEVLRRHPGDYAVQSFNPYSVRWMRRHAPCWPRGLLSGDFSETSLPRHQQLVLDKLLLVPWVRPHFIGYDIQALPSRAASLWRRAGVPLLAWTIRDEAALAKARAEADNVIFEAVSP